MLKIKTKSGFEVEVEEKVGDNMEFIDAVAEVDDGNPMAITKVVTMLLGKEEKKRLYDHVRVEDGRVPVEAISDEVTEIFNKMGENIKKQ